MSARIMTRGFPWGEPAHPGVVKYYEDLIAIYKVIRNQLQEGIDRAFDKVSSEIGFVVSTTLPMTLNVAEGGKAAQWEVPEPLKGSLFEKAMMDAVGKANLGKGISPGKYQLYLVWYEALKLKLRKDWLEPVHYLREDIAVRISEAARVRPEVQEPAHWFIPSEAIPVEEKVLISVIDEVYPELRLAERIATTRQWLRRVQPEVMEPAHFGTGRTADLALREIAQLFKQVRPDIREPAHFRLAERDVLAEIEAVVRRYGA